MAVDTADSVIEILGIMTAEEGADLVIDEGAALATEEEGADPDLVRTGTTVDTARVGETREAEKETVAAIDRVIETEMGDLVMMTTGTSMVQTRTVIMTHIAETVNDDRRQGEHSSHLDHNTVSSFCVEDEDH